MSREPRTTVAERIEELLDGYAEAERPATGHAPDLRIVDGTH